MNPIRVAHAETSLAQPRSVGRPWCEEASDDNKREQNEFHGLYYLLLLNVFPLFNARSDRLKAINAHSNVPGSFSLGRAEPRVEPVGAPARSPAGRAAVLRATKEAP